MQYPEKGPLALKNLEGSRSLLHLSGCTRSVVRKRFSKFAKPFVKSLHSWQVLDLRSCLKSNDDTDIPLRDGILSFNSCEEDLMRKIAWNIMNGKPWTVSAKQDSSTCCDMCFLLLSVMLFFLFLVFSGRDLRYFSGIPKGEAGRPEKNSSILLNPQSMRADANLTLASRVARSQKWWASRPSRKLHFETRYNVVFSLFDTARERPRAGRCCCCFKDFFTLQFSKLKRYERPHHANTIFSYYQKRKKGECMRSPNQLRDGSTRRALLPSSAVASCRRRRAPRRTNDLGRSIHQHISGRVRVRTCFTLRNGTSTRSVTFETTKVSFEKENFWMLRRSRRCFGWILRSMLHLTSLDRCTFRFSVESASSSRWSLNRWDRLRYSYAWAMEFSVWNREFLVFCGWYLVWLTISQNISEYRSSKTGFKLFKSTIHHVFCDLRGCLNWSELVEMGRTISCVAKV